MPADDDRISKHIHVDRVETARVLVEEFIAEGHEAIIVIGRDKLGRIHYGFCGAVKRRDMTRAGSALVDKGSGGSSR